MKRRLRTDSSNGTPNETKLSGVLILGADGEVLKETCHIIRLRFFKSGKPSAALRKIHVVNSEDARIVRTFLKNALAARFCGGGLSARLELSVTRQTCKSTFVGSPWGNSLATLPVRFAAKQTHSTPGSTQFREQIQHDHVGRQHFPRLAAKSAQKYLAQREPRKLSGSRNPGK